MSGTGIGEAGRGGLAVFWASVTLIAAAITIGAIHAGSVVGGLPFGSLGYFQSIRELREAGRVDEAIAELRGDQRINAQDQRSSLMLARLLREQGRPGAIESLGIAAQNSLSPYNRLNYAAGLASAGRAAEADIEIERALSVGADVAEVHVRIAQIHEELGRLERAESQYREALEIDPGSTEARRGLIRLSGAPDLSRSGK